MIVEIGSPEWIKTYIRIHKRMETNVPNEKAIRPTIDETREIMYQV